MSTYAYRNNTILPSSNSLPSFGSSYKVLVLEVGGQAASASSGTTLTLRSNHGFAAADKLLLESSGAIAETSYRTVSSVSTNTLTLDSALSVAAGDKVINLGADTGTTAPNYDASGVTIYADMAGEGSAVTNSTVTCDAYGFYEYWTQTTELWELVLDSSSSPVSVICDVFGATNIDIETTSTESAASSSYRGKLRVVQGGTGVADILQVCLKGEDDAYEWCNIGNGGE